MMTTVTSDDLMKFLQGFKEAMEVKIDGTKTAMEDKLETTRTGLEEKINSTNDKLDGKLNDLDLQVKKINTKIVDTDVFNARMDARLTALENEMKRSTILREKSSKLKELEKTLLVKNVDKDKEHLKTPDIPKDPLRLPSEDTANVFVDNVDRPEGTYRSLWAHELQMELKKVAETTTARKQTNDMTKVHNYVPEPVHDYVHDYVPDNTDVPDNWEEEEDRQSGGLSLSPQCQVKNNLKVRKPITIEKWFGEDTSTDGSEDSDTGTWQDVNRKKKNEERRRKIKRKRKERAELCSRKASHMAGIGPITMGMVNIYLNRGMNYEKAKLLALKDFLRDNLGYIQSELDELSVQETKFATRGENVLYVALSVREQVKELHVRRAENRNEEILVRNYVPPNLYERYMALNRECTGQRAADPNLKTQLRFGTHDVELFIKYRGEQSGYRQIKLSDFMDTNNLPSFDHKVHWKRFVDQPPRRKVTYKSVTAVTAKSVTAVTTNSVTAVKTVTGVTGSMDTVENPTGGKSPRITGLTRANSNSLSSENKKQKLASAVSSSSDEDEDEEDDYEGEDDMEMEGDELDVSNKSATSGTPTDKNN